MGLVPKIPEVEGAGILIAAFVGTTMAAATFLSRPLFIQGKGWTKDDFQIQKNDSIIAAILIFTISGAIMAVASGSLHGKGNEITHVLDMSSALEPSVGSMRSPVPAKVLIRPVSRSTFRIRWLPISAMYRNRSPSRAML